MSSQDPRVDDYIARAAPFAQPLLAHWRAVVHAACPQVQEAIKWGMPFFMHGDRMLAHMAAFKVHCAFDIHAGKIGKERERKQEAMGSFGRVTTLADLPPKKELTRLLKAGAAAIDRGERRPRPRKAEPKPPPVMPPDLAEALAARADAKRHFDAFSPSHQREYIEWINSAKQPQTRARRLAATVEQSAEGKSQNWRYERPKPAAKTEAKAKTNTEVDAEVETEAAPPHKAGGKPTVASKTAARSAAAKTAADTTMIATKAAPKKSERKAGAKTGG
jgi:uncharacterized protein YdeI (YjbR/CyaY-like superfamily)